MMTTTRTVPCADCQKVLHNDNTLENLYCGHNQRIAFRFPDSHIENIAVNSTEEAIKMDPRVRQAITTIVIEGLICLPFQIDTPR